MEGVGLSASQKNLMATIGTALYQFLRAEDFSESALEKFKATTLAHDSAVVDIQAYDDIHLAFFKFGVDLPTHIVAIGDFTGDAYTLLNRFKEESIAEYVSIWDTETPRNPLLNFWKRYNGHPTIELSELSQVYEKRLFSVTLKSENDDSKEYLIEGAKGTSAEGISILTEIAQNEFEILSLSTLISKFTTSEFSITNNGVVDDEAFHDATWNLVEKLLTVSV